MVRLTVLGVILGIGLAAAAHGQQTIGGCQVLPSNNIWNTPVEALPVLSNSASMVNTIGANRGFHPDFGWDGGPIGIPFVTVSGSQTKYPAAFHWPGESDPGPYAVPLDAPIEGGGDRHAIAVDTDNCILYELYSAFPQASSWTAHSGAIFDLRSNGLRPETWTSADAAGLPIMPGLVTYEEVLSGEIRHAIRFTAPQTRREYVWPARHYASSLTGSQYPRMGERFRLKADFDVTTYPSDVQVILRAMKKYGIILADNGAAWYITGKPDTRWNNDELHSLVRVLGSNFEAVDATVLMIDPNSGEAIQTNPSPSVLSVSPASGSGPSQTFTYLFSDGDGFTDISWAAMLINGGSVAGGCVTLFDRGSNGIWLLNDAATSWLGPVVVGSAGAVQNSQCLVDAGASSASGSSANLTVNLAVTFKGTFAGAKTIYAMATDASNGSSGLQAKGTFTVTNQAPTAALVTPASGSGSTQTFSYLFTDSNGHADIAWAAVLINGTPTAPNGCVLFFDRVSNQFWLLNDIGSSWEGPVTAGAGGPLQNSQCILNGAGSSSSGSNATLAVNAALTFKAAFAGAKANFAIAADHQNESAGWQLNGTWTVP